MVRPTPHNNPSGVSSAPSERELEQSATTLQHDRPHADGRLRDGGTVEGSPFVIPPPVGDRDGLAGGRFDGFERPAAPRRGSLGSSRGSRSSRSLAGGPDGHSHTYAQHDGGRRSGSSLSRSQGGDSTWDPSPDGLKESPADGSTSYAFSRSSIDGVQDQDGLAGDRRGPRAPAGDREAGTPFALIDGHPAMSESRSRSTETSSNPSGPPLANTVVPPGVTIAAPPPRLKGLPLSGSEPGTNRFVLMVRQHPKQGRQCGFGVKDKRPLDPLPIVQLKIYREDNSIDEEATNSPKLLMQVSLQRVDAATGAGQESTLVGQPSDTTFPWTRMLEGRLAVSPHVVRDLDGSKACFFVFTDLSVRLQGLFRLHFQLILLGPPPLLTDSAGTGNNVVASIETNVFTIYSPRRFPGMTESTELAKALARQGVQIPIRNDVRRKHEQ